ncbi:MAG: restriction endonuclease subunit S [Candidatus Rokubacteria bacterium]|nr:restriction endonuclease subunit S [Candidatus Rokubacteria bacterium]
MNRANETHAAAGRRRFKPYPAYKNSGVEWLGKIPVGWGIKRLKRVVQFRGGGTPTKDQAEYWRGDIPWVSPKDMKVSVVLDTEDKITAQAIRDSATKLVQAGAVLIVVRSGILVHSIPVALTGCEVTLNQDLKALIPHSELLPEYLVYLISGMQRELLVEWKKEGATVESLELELVANTPTPLPAIAEQRAIAAFLDRETARIDALVANKERLIELLREKRTALITRAVTKGRDPNVPMKDSGIEWLGEIPAHWEVVPVYARYEVALGKMLDAKRVTGESSGCYLRNVDVQWDAVNTAGLPDMDFAPWERGRYVLRPGDLLVCEGGEVGRTAIWRGDIEECFYQKAIHRVRPRSEKEAPRFFYYLMCTLAKRGVFVAGGNPNTIDHLTAVQLRHYRLPFAAPQEQRAIAAFLDRETAKIDGLVAKVRDAIDRLKELRTALISAAVTGKIDVREHAA